MADSYTLPKPNETAAGVPPAWFQKQCAQRRIVPTGNHSVYEMVVHTPMGEVLADSGDTITLGDDGALTVSKD
ncbi:MAG: hypothetical protein Q8R98_03615 [Rubrivivax sp.]|nr:hypothetical protein [Rubrivivax sp.]MDP3610915.1 hypothetical protein [Rubrivivax sp.]